MTEPLQDMQPGFTAQVIGTGPTVRNSAMPEMFENLMYAARNELLITTPYYVPSESMQSSLCASARRGVATTIIFPARNDSWIVAAASRSYYEDLLTAGVRLFEYEDGLLHDRELTQAMRGRQREYLNRSRPVTIEKINQWPLRRRLINNTIATNKLASCTAVYHD